MPGQRIGERRGLVRAAHDADANFSPAAPLRVLYAGRLERRKGVPNLVRAVTGMERTDVRLTLVGADTDTAPLGVSMREQLQLAIAEDERIELRSSLPRAAVAATRRAICGRLRSRSPAG